MKRFSKRLCLLLSVCGLIISSSAYAQNLEKIDILGLQNLSELYVTSVTKRPEIKFKAASAISVISQEDIQRSGATSIAEALRLVPGLSVARIDSNKWAISGRGFSRQFSNKLLVLIDGRSVYTPLFSGVYWDIQDTILADIDRIEVIRGPGATIWGANAVNGVINIITKKAQNTQGNHLSIIYGDHEDGTVAFRHGGQINDDVFYRAYIKGVARDEFTAVESGNGNGDESKQYRTGFRVDSTPSSSDQWRLSGDAYVGELQSTNSFPGLVMPAVFTEADGDETYDGINLLGSWERHNHSTYHKMQAYVDYTKRDWENMVDQRILTLDLNYQNHSKLNDRNDLVWGLGYRYIWDDIEGKVLNNNQPYLLYTPRRGLGSIYNGFIQNEFKLLPDVLHLTLGTKVEHNYFTDFEIQPNVRFSWYPSDIHTVWGAVSKASRTPTRAERTISLIAASTPGGFVRLAGAKNFDSEDLIAYELGHRYKTSERLTFDNSIFYNVYDNLRTLEPGSSSFPIAGTAAEFITSNFGSAETYGVEIEAEYTVTKNWSLSANYSYIKLNMHSDKSSADTSIAAEEGKTPEQQFTLLSRLNLPHNLELDTNVTFVDELPSFDIPSYTRLDTRIGWRPRDGVEVSLTGQNLLDPEHPEFQPFLYTPAAEVSRSVFVKLNLNF